MKRGFTLIELMVSLGLAAILLVILFQSFSFIQKAFRSTMARSEMLAVQVPLTDLLYRDISTILPHTPRPRKEAQGEDEEKKTGEEGAEKGEKQPEKKEQEPKELIPVQIVATEDKKGTVFMTFISTNRLSSYHLVKSFPVRIIYQKMADGSLVRYESNDYTTSVHNAREIAQFVATHKLVPLVLCDRVVVFDVRAIVFAEEKKKGAQLELATWGSDEVRKETERIVPDACSVKIECLIGGAERFFEETVPILSSEQERPVSPQAAAFQAAFQKSGGAPGGPGGKGVNAQAGKAQSGSSAVRASLLQKIERFV